MLYGEIRNRLLTEEMFKTDKSLIKLTNLLFSKLGNGQGIQYLEQAQLNEQLLVYNFRTTGWHNQILKRNSN